VLLVGVGEMRNTEKLQSENTTGISRGRSRREREG